MPKSKRQTVVHLTRTAKKSKEHKAELIEEVRTLAEGSRYIWVFSVEHMRNLFMQEIRQAWKPDRIFFGRNAVMRKALGASEEEEARPGCRLIASALDGNVGLLFTNEKPNTVTEYFESFKKPDYPRTSNVAPETITLPAGPVMLEEKDGSVAPHSLEPQLRKLGLATSLVKGVPTLHAPHTICTKGQVLDSNQANLLKIFNKPLAVFQVIPKKCLDLEKAELIPI